MTQTKEIVKQEPEFFSLLVPDEIKKHISPSATDREIQLFLIQARLWELNPFKREIYLVKYSPQQPASIVIGFESFLKRAERTNKLKGWKAWTEGECMGKDFKAIIEIHRADWNQPFVHEVFFDEYKAVKPDGTLTRFWASKPRTMLKKVVISQGFRLCFPDELGGMPYTAEEVNSIESEELPKADVQVLPKIDEIKVTIPAQAKPKYEPEPDDQEEEPPLPTEEDAPKEPESNVNSLFEPILKAFLTLNELGRPRKELEPLLRKAMAEKFGSSTATAKIPEELTKDQAEWTLYKLGKTIEKAQKGKEEAGK